VSEVRKELNQIWQSTIDQFDEIKDAIVKSSQAGKAKLDAAFLKRQRERLLAQLGEEVLRAVDEGTATLPASTEETVKRLRELAAQIRAEEEEAERLMNRGA
jgi:hypothetical protein